MIYGDFKSIPCPETHPKSPKEIYGGAKYDHTRPTTQLYGCGKYGNEDFDFEDFVDFMDSDNFEDFEDLEIWRIWWIWGMSRIT